MGGEPAFKKRVFPKGSVLIEEGVVGTEVFLIRKGKVEIRKGVLRSFPQTLGIRTAGDIIGEMAVIDRNPAMASAIALEETEVTAMSGDEFRARIDQLDPIVKGTILVIVRRAREMADTIMRRVDPFAKT